MIKLKNILNEWPDKIWIDDKTSVEHFDDGNYPFGYNENNSEEMLVGGEQSTHSFNMNVDDINGRIWSKLKTISFWIYPKTKSQLMKVITDVNNALEKNDIDIKIDNSWTVEVPNVLNSGNFHELSLEKRIKRFDTYVGQSVFIPIQDYDIDSIKNPQEFVDQESRKQRQLHTMSPLHKPQQNVPVGLGSKKQHAYAAQGFGESRQRIVRLLKESMEHKVALEMLRDLIKGTEWEGKVFLAGGAVRDELMGKDVKDLDLTVAAKDGGILFATWLAKKLGIYREETNPVTYPRFGTAKISLRGVNYQGTDLSKVDIETVMTRKEQYPDPLSRKPDVEFGTPEQDAERRDLTINSLMKDLSTGEIKDFTGKGFDDLKNKVIRTPIDADIIFKEDPLRMLRAVRFTVKYGWKLPLSMIRALKKNAPLLQNISVERIQEELNKILLTERPHTGVKLLYILGLNKFIAPEFEKLVGMAQNDFHQWSADRHTYEVIKNTPPNIITRLAAFFHDIGKGETRTEKKSIICKNCYKKIDIK